MGLKLKVSVCSKRTSSYDVPSNHVWRQKCLLLFLNGHTQRPDGHIEGRGAMNHTNWDNHFLEHIYGVALSCTRKKSNCVENERRYLEKEVQILPTFSLPQTWTFCRVKWACFWDFRKLQNLSDAVSPIPTLERCDEGGTKTSVEAYWHLYESDVHFWHLIISQVLHCLYVDLGTIAAYYILLLCCYI